MRQNIYTIHDLKAESYYMMFTTDNDATATRQIQQTLLSDDKTPYAMFPEDFELVCVGFYNSSTGSVVGLDEPKRVCGFDVLLGKEAL